MAHPINDYDGRLILVGADPVVKVPSTGKGPSPYDKSLRTAMNAAIDIYHDHVQPAPERARQLRRLAAYWNDLAARLED